MFPVDYLSQLGLKVVDAHAPATPLTEIEQLELAEALDEPQLPDTTMTLEELDGLFCALAVGPSVVKALPPAAWLAVAFGDDEPPRWSDANHARRVYSLMLRHFHAVQAALTLPKAGLTEETVYAPWVFEVEEADRVQPVSLDSSGQRLGEWSGRWWAAGFCAGLAEWQPEWQPLLDDEEAGELVDPFIQLERGYDELDPKALFDDEEALTRCVLAAYEMRHWWQTTASHHRKH